MRLYSYRYSPNPMKVRFALAELEIPYDTVELNLMRGDQRTDEFLGINPAGQVPVLQHGSLTVRESNAIISYLGRYYGRNLWPKRSEKEALAYQWLHFESYALSKYLGTLWFGELVSPLIGKKVSQEKLDSAANELKPELSIVEKHLGSYPYFLDQDFSLVDCSLGVTLMLWRGTQIEDETVYPNIASYLERIRRRKVWLEIDGDGLQQLRGIRFPTLGTASSEAESPTE